MMSAALSYQKLLEGENGDLYELKALRNCEKSIAGVPSPTKVLLKEFQRMVFDGERKSVIIVHALSNVRKYYDNLGFSVVCQMRAKPEHLHKQLEDPPHGLADNMIDRVQEWKAAAGTNREDKSNPVMVKTWKMWRDQH